MKDFKISNEKKIDTGFVIPDNYFDDLYEKINLKLKNEPKVIPLHRRLKFWISAVAAVLLIGFSLTIYQKNSNFEKSSSELLAFEDSLNNEDIVDQLTEKEIIALEIELNLYDLETENIINDYL